jgi:hypothetical protein
MSSIGNKFSPYTVPKTPLDNKGMSQSFRGECTPEQLEEFEKALHCVESNVAKRGRNQRDWDARCVEVDTAAVAHGTFWGAAGGAAFAAGGTRPGMPPQVVAGNVAIGAVISAAVGLGQTVADPDNVSNVNPADYFNENPLK